MPHILMMHLSWAWLVILLHRPFYRPLASMASRAEEGAAPTGYGAALAVKVSLTVLLAQFRMY